MDAYDEKLLEQQLDYIYWPWERLSDGTYINSNTGELIRENDKKEPSFYTDRAQMEHNARAFAQKWGRNISSAFKKQISKNKDSIFNKKNPKVYQHEWHECMRQYSNKSTPGADCSQPCKNNKEYWGPSTDKDILCVPENSNSDIKTHDEYSGYKDLVKTFFEEPKGLAHAASVAGTPWHPPQPVTNQILNSDKQIDKYTGFANEIKIHHYKPESPYAYNSPSTSLLPPLPPLEPRKSLFNCLPGGSCYGGKKFKRTKKIKKRAKKSRKQKKNKKRSSKKRNKSRRKN